MPSRFSSFLSWLRPSERISSRSSPDRLPILSMLLVESARWRQALSPLRLLSIFSMGGHSPISSTWAQRARKRLHFVRAAGSRCAAAAVPRRACLCA